MGISDPHRLCERCREVPLFGKRRICDACKQLGKQEAAKQYNRRSLLAKYGLSVDEYDRLFTAQHGVCAVCGRPEKSVGSSRHGGPISLAIDHDHVTGRVRGLLCAGCNTGPVKAIDDMVSVLGVPRTMRALHYVLDEYETEVAA